MLYFGFLTSSSSLIAESEETLVLFICCVSGILGLEVIGCRGMCIHDFVRRTVSVHDCSDPSYS